MAVFTPLSDQDARTLLLHFNLGELVSFQGITAGSENTNYFLTTTGGEYVLTLFERLTQAQLPFYLELMYSLAQQGLPVPHPQIQHNGSKFAQIHHKPCTIVTRFQGEYEPEPGPIHCQQVGQMLARIHKAAHPLPLYQPNLLGLSWWQHITAHLSPFLNDDQTQLLAQTLDEQIQFATTPLWQSLPAGPAHCDLFRDNVLFSGTRYAPHLEGVIDFYFAGHDTWLFDVAVSVNDWCIAPHTAALIPELTHAWLNAYAQERPFTEAEKQLWPTMLRAAALRFWLSRLRDFYLPRPAHNVKPLDPQHLERLLRVRCDQPPPPLP